MYKSSSCKVKTNIYKWSCGIYKAHTVVFSVSNFYSNFCSTNDLVRRGVELVAHHVRRRHGSPAPHVHHIEVVVVVAHEAGLGRASVVDWSVPVLRGH